MTTRRFRLLALLATALLQAGIGLAQENILTSYNSTYKGVQYRVVLNMDMVFATRNFDPTTSEFPASLTEVIRNCSVSLNRVDEGAGWQLYNLQLNQYQRSEGMFWYYTLSFRSGTGNEYFSMMATIDGTAAKIRRIEEIDL